MTSKKKESKKTTTAEEPPKDPCECANLVQELGFDPETFKELKIAFETFDHDKKGFLQVPDALLLLRSIGEHASHKDILKLPGSVLSFGDFLRREAKKLSRPTKVPEQLSFALKCFERDGSIGCASLTEISRELVSAGEPFSAEELDQFARDSNSDPRTSLFSSSALNQLLSK